MTPSAQFGCRSIYLKRLIYHQKSCRAQLLLNCSNKPTAKRDRLLLRRLKDIQNMPREGRCQRPNLLSKCSQIRKFPKWSIKAKISSSPLLWLSRTWAWTDYGLSHKWMFITHCYNCILGDWQLKQLTDCTETHFLEGMCGDSFKKGMGNFMERPFGRNDGI